MVTNSGSIAGTNVIGIDLTAGGTVVNNAAASISSGGFGVAVYGGNATVTNAGTITGGVGSVRFANSGTDRLVVEPGAVFNGAAVGGSGNNTLELAGNSPGSIGGVNTGTFANFGSMIVDSGASWTLTGAGAVPVILNDGSLHVGGSLTISTDIAAASTGLFILDGSASMQVAAALGTATQISFTAGSDLLLDNTSQFGTGVGTTNYVGSLLENFGAGSQIDLTNFSSASLNFTFNAGNGLLQLTNGVSQAASLSFQTSSLGSTSFQFGSDGASGILVKVA